MRVLVVSATFPPMKSGGADYAFRLCQRLAEAGVEVNVVTSRIENVATDNRMSVYPVMRDWSWAELPRLLKIARRCRPDVVNLHYADIIYKGHPMVTLLPTIMKRLDPRLRFITHMESTRTWREMNLSLAGRAIHRAVGYWAGGNTVDFIYGTLLRDSDAIITLSNVQRDALARQSASVAARCTLIPPPPLMKMYEKEDGRLRGREMLGASPDEFLLAYFGYVYPYKGLETLFGALKLLTKRKVRLVIIGGTNEVVLSDIGRPNYLLELKDLARDLDVSDRILWTGYYPTDSDEASAYLRSADACVLPFDEGVSLNNSSFAASMAHGLPTITTRGETLEPCLVHGTNTLLCPPRDPRSLAATVESLMDNDDLRHRLSEGALELADAWFSWNKALERTIDVFSGKANPQ